MVAGADLRLWGLWQHSSVSCAGHIKARVFGQRLPEILNGSPYSEAGAYPLFPCLCRLLKASSHHCASACAFTIAAASCSRASRFPSKPGCMRDGAEQCKKPAISGGLKALSFTGNTASRKGDVMLLCVFAQQVRRILAHLETLVNSYFLGFLQS